MGHNENHSKNGTVNSVPAVLVMEVNRVCVRSMKGITFQINRQNEGDAQ